jgi:hypothetical protein
MRFSAIHCFSTDCTVALNLLIAISWGRAISVDGDHTVKTQCRSQVATVHRYRFNTHMSNVYESQTPSMPIHGLGVDAQLEGI